MRNEHNRKLRLWITVIVFVVITAGVVYFVFNPEQSAWFPKCPFLVLTGLKCPGCGSQRTFHALLHLDFRSAFRYNALMIILVPYIILLFAGEIVRYVRPQSRFTYLIQTPTIIWCVFGAIMAFGITRNIFGF